jgi:hypothetical protein
MRPPACSDWYPDASPESDRDWGDKTTSCRFDFLPAVFCFWPLTPDKAYAHSTGVLAGLGPCVELGE